MSQDSVSGMTERITRLTSADEGSVLQSIFSSKYNVHLILDMAYTARILCGLRNAECRPRVFCGM